MGWLGWLFGREAPKPHLGGPIVEATVTGIYAVIHTDVGDLDLGPPTRLDMDCEWITFWFTTKVERDCTPYGLTIHLGVEHSRCEIDVPKLRAGDNLTVDQIVEISGLHYVGRGAR